MGKRKRQQQEQLQALRDDIARVRTELTTETAAALTREIAALRAELDAERTSRSQIAERISSTEVTIQSLGNELSRQLHELGNDIDELARRVNDDEVKTRVEELRSAQVRLANEQARYEIAFRMDLATIAEQLNRR